MKRVTIIIPCFNEQSGIAKVINAFPKRELAIQGYEIDILVVDNNSTDNTAEVAASAGARVIFEKKQGKGNAIRTGFYNIGKKCDFVVMLDGDNTYKAEEIGRLLEPLKSNFSKVIIGSRLAGQISEGSMKWLNRFGNWGYSHAVRYIYKVNVTDVLTGYFAWNREVVESLRQHLISDGFAVEMEMITKMARLGYEIYSVPITYAQRAGSSSLKPIRDGLRIMMMFIKNLYWQPKGTVLDKKSSKLKDALYYRIEFRKN